MTPPLASGYSVRESQAVQAALNPLGGDAVSVRWPDVKWPQKHMTYPTPYRWAIRLAAALFIGWLLWLAVALLPWAYLAIFGD